MSCEFATPLILTSRPVTLLAPFKVQDKPAPGNHLHHFNNLIVIFLRILKANPEVFTNMSVMSEKKFADRKVHLR